MEKSVAVQRTICDICETEQAWLSCNECGKDICIQCEKKHAVRYYGTVYLEGFGDAIYCADCHAKKMADPDKIFEAYRAIQLLRDERDKFNDAFTIRCDKAVDALKKLRKDNQK